MSLHGDEGGEGGAREGMGVVCCSSVGAAAETDKLHAIIEMRPPCAILIFLSMKALDDCLCPLAKYVLCSHFRSVHHGISL